MSRKTELRCVCRCQKIWQIWSGVCPQRAMRSRPTRRRSKFLTDGDLLLKLSIFLAEIVQSPTVVVFPVSSQAWWGLPLDLFMLLLAPLMVAVLAM